MRNTHSFCDRMVVWGKSGEGGLIGGSPPSQAVVQGGQGVGGYPLDSVSLGARSPAGLPPSTGYPEVVLGVWYVGTVPGQGLGPLQVAWGIVWFLLLGFQRRGTWA